MSLMDARALFYTGYWRQAADNSQSIHRFRSHTKEELLSFRRLLNKRMSRDRRVVQLQFRFLGPAAWQPEISPQRPPFQF
jgi:hypothetical protein